MVFVEHFNLFINLLYVSDPLSILFLPTFQMAIYQTNSAIINIHVNNHSTFVA